MNDKVVSVLLLEDDAVDVMNVKRAFKKNNVQNPLHVAGNGVEGLAMLRGGEGIPMLEPRPKIILLDLNMPKMNGIEFLQHLRTDPELKSISVVVLTTSNDDRDVVAAYGLNVAGYILKPVGFESFVEAVRTLNMFWALNEVP